MVSLWDYHTHCYLNHHAVGTSREYVESAIAKGLQEIGLSDHFPMHLLPESAAVGGFAMTMKEFEQYFAENLQLQKEFRTQISIKIAS